MPDLVFVRANKNAPVREGDAVILTSPTTIGVVQHQDVGTPSGNASFAQTVLAGRFRNHGYYVGASGDQPDNSTQPAF